MRIGIFGGSFDPVHLGHLILAEQCREQAALDVVLFVLAPRPPHKLDQALTPYGRRRDMVELALAGYPVFQVSDVERDRVGPSYTVETLELLAAQHPGAHLFLLLGSDSLGELPTWRAPDRIAQLATLLVVDRPDAPPAAEQAGPAPWRVQHVPAPLVHISSTDIRKRVAARRSIRYLTPRAVECYIETHGLYRAP